MVEFVIMWFAAQHVLARNVHSAAGGGSVLSASLIWFIVLFKLSLFWLSPASSFLLIIECVGVLEFPTVKVVLSLSSIPYFFFLYLGAVIFGPYTFIIIAFFC